MNTARYYSIYHQWVERIDEKTIQVGLTDFITFKMINIIALDIDYYDFDENMLELMEGLVDELMVSTGEKIGEIKYIHDYPISPPGFMLKDILAPLPGLIIDINEDITSEPNQLIRNNSIWIFKMEINPESIDQLMTLDEYNQLYR